MKAEEFRIQDLLNFRPDLGQIHLGEDRAMIFRQNAFKTLRSLMLDQLGSDTTHSILFKFGYQSALADYQSLNNCFHFDSEEDRLAAGPLMHSCLGIVSVEPLEQHINRELGQFYFRGLWHNSFEAEIYKQRYGYSQTPVCFSLAGYGSGWCTAFSGIPVIEIETKCMAQGYDHCEWEIKSLEEWGEEASPWLNALHFDEPSMYKDLEKSRNDLEAMNRTLERRVKQRTDRLKTLLKILCHDIKEPAHKILKESSELETNGSGVNIQSLSQTILKLIEKVEEEQIEERYFHPPEPENIIFSSLIEKSIPYFQQGLFDKSIVFDFKNSSTRKVKLSIHEGAFINHIVPNLVKNSIKYSQMGGQISLKTSIKNSEFELSVSDKGYGIPKNRILKLLKSSVDPDPDFAPELNTGESSHGWGLHLVNKLVLNMNGRMEIESNHISEHPLNHGTTIKILLPIAP